MWTGVHLELTAVKPKILPTSFTQNIVSYYLYLLSFQHIYLSIYNSCLIAVLWFIIIVDFRRLWLHENICCGPD